MKTVHFRLDHERVVSVVLSQTRCTKSYVKIRPRLGDEYDPEIRQILQSTPSNKAEFLEAEYLLFNGVNTPEKPKNSGLLFSNSVNT